jgi:hypothetical protein
MSEFVIAYDHSASQLVVNEKSLVADRAGLRMGVISGVTGLQVRRQLGDLVPTDCAENDPGQGHEQCWDGHGWRYIHWALLDRPLPGRM